MAVVTTTFGSSPTALAVTALHSIATNTFWKSAQVNFSTNSPVFVIVQVTLVTSTTAGSATGYSNVYLACSLDGTDYDVNLTAGDAAWTNTTPSAAEQSKSLQLLGRISMQTTAASSYTYRKTFFVPPGAVPKYGVFVIENQRGATLAAAGSLVEYMECGFTIT